MPALLGSGFETEDAVQETLIRAWRGVDRFEGRSTLRSWLYSVDTNVCLNMLPPRQRAVLILRDVLRSSGADVAELLETSVASVKSALQRARATLATSGMAGSDRWTPTVPMDGVHQALLDRYVEAVERWDVDAPVALLHEDATLTMPPRPRQGAASIDRWFQIKHLELRVLPTAANGSPALGVYWRHRPGGPYEAFHLQVVEVSAGRITRDPLVPQPKRGVSQPSGESEALQPCSTSSTCQPDSTGDASPLSGPVHDGLMPNRPGWRVPGRRASELHRSTAPHGSSWV